MSIHGVCLLNSSNGLKIPKDDAKFRDRCLFLAGRNSIYTNLIIQAEVVLQYTCTYNVGKTDNKTISAFIVVSSCILVTYNKIIRILKYVRELYINFCNIILDTLFSKE